MFYQAIRNTILTTHDKCACFYASYYSIQVFEQVVGHNTQAMDLSEQAKQVLTRMKTDFRWQVADLYAIHTCGGGTSMCGLFKI